MRRRSSKSSHLQCIGHTTIDDGWNRNDGGAWTTVWISWATAIVAGALQSGGSWSSPLPCWNSSCDSYPPNARSNTLSLDPCSILRPVQFSTEFKRNRSLIEKNRYCRYPSTNTAHGRWPDYSRYVTEENQLHPKSQCVSPAAAFGVVTWFHQTPARSVWAIYDILQIICLC
jgi:hypothetical protein